MKLSILIPSIPERNWQLCHLVGHLTVQQDRLYKDHESLGLLQILISDDKKFLDGGMSIGEKRQKLLDEAEGEYCCFLDDDEWVAPNYIEELMRAAQHGKDVISFNCMVHTDNYWSMILMDLAHLEDEQLRPGLVLRKPWHICPIKREIAQSEKF